MNNYQFKYQNLLREAWFLGNFNFSARAYTLDTLLKTIEYCYFRGGKVARIVSNNADRSLAKIFYNKPKNQQYFLYLLAILSKKYCRNCLKVKTIEEFYTNSTKLSGCATYCKDCDKDYQVNYYKRNKIVFRTKNVKYRANKNKRIPKWANLTKIKEIYNNCPKGYHVDHIIPLQGKNISGLHVENNLQYLTAKENLQKSNKFNGE